MDKACLFQNDVAQIGCLESVFGRIIGIAGFFAGLLFLVMLLIGGFKYLFSGGDAKKTESAKGTLTAAFLGLILIVGSYIILAIIANFTGLTELTSFTIPTF